MNDKIAIQDCYSSDNAHCWGCGKDHPSGLHLKSYLLEDGSCVMEHTPDALYTGGVPENLYGGYIAMLFDCHGTGSAAAFYHHAQQKNIGEGNLDRFVTAHLEVDFKRPTPLNIMLKIVAHLEEVTPRKVVLRMALYAEEQLTAEAKMVAVRFVPKSE